MGDVVECKSSMLKKEKTVLYFQTSFCDSNLQQRSGFYGFARKAGWFVHVIEYGAQVAEKPKPDTAELFGFWNPDGCVVDCGGADVLMTLADFRAVPTVFIDRHPSSIERGAVCVTHDSASIARLAARELLSLGLSAYAFVDWHLPTVWSDDRGDAFRRIVESNGARFFRHRLLSLTGSEGMDDLSRWLSSLPAPCGVFTANDRIAGCVVAAALKAGLGVPQDIAVVGVDNDTGQCETLPVSVSSISLDRESVGHAAARLLATMMEGGRRSATSVNVVGAMAVMRRASTRRFVDRRVAAAVEHIRKHACDGVTVSDVVGVMGCSRSLAYLRFAEEVGHSILEEIQSVRVAHAGELLRKGTLSVDAVGDFSGYSSTSEFRRAFKRRTGLSPKAYSRGHRNS